MDTKTMLEIFAFVVNAGAILFVAGKFFGKLETMSETLKETEARLDKLEESQSVLSAISARIEMMLQELGRLRDRMDKMLDGAVKP